MSETAKAAVFEIEDCTGPVPGYTFGRHWNGWACPYFAKEEADKIMARWPGMTYDAGADAYTVVYEGDCQETDTYPAMTIATEAGPVKVYAIGNGFWCWDKVKAA